MVEDETHVLLQCPLYNTLRNEIVLKATSINNDFSSFSVPDKISFLLSDENMVKYSAKTCHEILRLRRNYMYK